MVPKVSKTASLAETATRGRSRSRPVAESQPFPEPNQGWWSGGLGQGPTSVTQAPTRDHDRYRLAKVKTTWSKIRKFLTFLGPGAVISVAYIDPDNYQTAIASGASFRYRLLFMVLFSNLIAIYFQTLAVKLGSVTGLTLAEMNHKWLPRWLDLFIYAMAEASIICTDLGTVIGTAIALNILIPSLPLPAACVLSVVETLFILLFYAPDGHLRRIRIFELFIALLVLAVLVTIVLALSHISGPAGAILRGYLPSRDIFVGEGLYESCAVLGGTLMPHALYVGTSLTRARLYAFDGKHSSPPHAGPTTSSDSPAYRPSLGAIRSCLNYSFAELALTLFTVAVFVNSALLIISASAFYRSDSKEDISSDLYDLYDLFNEIIGPVAAVLFALSLLFSGLSSGLVSTMAGQIVMEGALSLRLSPFMRRLITRCVAIVPALIIALAVGRKGLSQALVACNYVLAISLIFVTAPLVWFTCLVKYMTVPAADGGLPVAMHNGWAMTGAGAVLWLLVVSMDIATLVLLGLGITAEG